MAQHTRNGVFVVEPRVGGAAAGGRGGRSALQRVRLGQLDPGLYESPSELDDAAVGVLAQDLLDESRQLGRCQAGQARLGSLQLPQLLAELPAICDRGLEPLPIEAAVPLREELR
jgi:hypothetical protein